MRGGPGRSQAASAGRETRLLSLGAVPALLAAHMYTGGREIIEEFHTFDIGEPAIKAFYMMFICVFCWGAVVFGSMNDPFYDTDMYRDAGGNGTQHYIYSREEEEEEEAREELWKEELMREIEGRLDEVKEIGDKEKEEEEMLV
eukprot:SM001369S00002  [mRNA]  locus=s1369:815:1869:- [translate_table: standard]